MRNIFIGLLNVAFILSLTMGAPSIYADPPQNRHGQHQHAGPAAGNVPASFPHPRHDGRRTHNWNKNNQPQNFSHGNNWHHRDHHDGRQHFHNRGNRNFYSQPYVINPVIPIIPYIYQPSSSSDSSYYNYYPSTPNDYEQTISNQETTTISQTPNGTWVESASGNVPDQAISYRSINGNTTYYCRATFRGVMIYGELVPNDACYAHDQSASLRFDSYDVLVSE